jgi:hypothetical protein
MGSKSRQSPIHFPSLCCHQGISVPRKALEIKSYLWFTPTTQVLLLTCQGHTFMWSTVDAPILISSPFNQQISFGLAIHHFLHCSHPMEFKRSFFPSASQFYLTTKPQTIVLFSMIQSTKHFQCSPLNASPCPLHYIWNPNTNSLDAVGMSFTTTTTRCLYISYVHDSTLLWDHIEAPTTSHHVLRVCARSFIEIDHDVARSMIACNMQLHNLGML